MLQQSKYKTEEQRLAARTAAKRKYYLANKEQVIARAAAWQQANKDRVKTLAKQRRASNPEKYREYSAKFRVNNLEENKAYMRQWKAANPGKVNAATAKRYTTKIQRTPSWLNKLQLKEISKYYVEAARLTKLTGVSFHVDHIIPLKGKTISGLHVPWNLQVLPYYINLEKNNKYVA